MGQLSLAAMQAYLTKSIASKLVKGETTKLNKNKLNGLLAEVELRKYLTALGFADRVSPGGWICRSKGAGNFAQKHVVVFPRTILPDVDYPPDGADPAASPALHSIAGVFREAGIEPYYCHATVTADEAHESVSWRAQLLGQATSQPFAPFPQNMSGFNARAKKYNSLKYKTDVTTIPDYAVPEEFSKEHLRVTFANKWMAEISDVDGVFYGSKVTYPVEIKEKTSAKDNNVGEWFGLDLGPFVKLAFYAARRDTLKSLFIVREIDSADTRQLVDWWFIPFAELAQVASWVQVGGGKSMTGGNSSVVKIPKAAFKKLDAANLASL